MQGSPPRRSRRPPQNDGPSFPLVPMLIGVIVVGFAIGSGLSLFAKHGAGDATVAAAPTIAATIPPATDVVPSDSPSPFETDTPAPRPSHSAKPSPSPRPPSKSSPVSSPASFASASASPSSSASPSLAASASPSIVPSQDASPPPSARAVVRDETASPTTTPTIRSTPSPEAASAEPSAAATTESASETAHGATTPFAKLAASVVRVYLNAIARGDDDTARAELASPSSGPLAEDSVVDQQTHIGRVDVRGSGDLVTVDVDLQTTSGPYAARFTVTRSATGAALIGSHSIVKS